MTFAFALFEIFNSFLYDSNTDYLNYDTTKALICFFSIYGIVHKKLNTAFVIILVIFTIIILSLYVTRMIFISYFFVLSFLLIGNRTRISLLFIIVPLLFILNFFFTDFDFKKIKLVYTFSQALENGINFNSLVFLDPVRFYELKAFLDSGIGILIGNGLGSGFYDVKGYFNFVDFDDTAFSHNELRSKIFINFHDVWVDIGYRFGLVSMMFLYIPLIKGMISKDAEVSTLASILIILLTCSFYSSAGLIMIALLYSAFLSSFKRIDSRSYV